MKLDAYRNEIDAMDKTLVQVLEQRLLIARKIAAYKSSAGLPIQDKNREAALLDSRTQNIEDPEVKMAVREIFEAILKESRGIQASTLKNQHIDE